MEPSLRNYRPSDLEACRRLWVEMTQWHRDLYASPGIGGDQPGLQFDEHLAEVGAENIIVAEADGVVVGMTGLIVRPTEVELEPLVVSAAMRGHRIGRMLTAAVIDRARALGAGTVVVKPAARNMAAIRLFVGSGFDVLGQVELMLDLEPGKTAWHPADLGDLPLRY